MAMPTDEREPFFDDAMRGCLVVAVVVTVLAIILARLI